MQDMLATIFLVLLLVLYAGIALIFVVTWVRDLIWRPLRSRLSGRHAEKSYSQDQVYDP